MGNPLLIPELRELIRTGKLKELNEFCESGHPEIIAEFISTLEPSEAWETIRHSPPNIRADIFSRLSVDFQIEIVATQRQEDVARLLSDMPPDDRADLCKLIPEDKRESILPAMAQAEREDIRRLSAYPEGTAGAVMTSDYASLKSDITISEAIARLRLEAPNKETIYYAYVVNESRKLIGFISLKDLILARPEAFVRDIMHDEVLFARVTDDQEDAARKIQNYDFIALPVVNGGGVLVGIITYDDAIDIINQELTEDVEKLMAIGGAHEYGAYLKTSSWEHFRNRCGWIIILAVLGLVSGFVVQHFEGLFLQFAILATFMPMVADTGGNTGSQSSTLVVRALAMKEISYRDLATVMVKELKVALMLGIVLAFLAFCRVVLFGGMSHMSQGTPLITIGFAIAAALGLQVITATLIGAFLPIAAARFRFDPAVVASPALTTIVDITGLLIYFTIAKLIIGL